jgi:branched-chain amino acid transport system substrate-binding protein
VTGFRRSVCAALVLVLAACTSGDEGSASTTTTAPATTTTTVATTTTTIASRVDGKLVVGALLPAADTSPELAATLTAGIALAVEDIDDAGGSLGSAIELVEWQMSTAGASEALAGFDALIEERADVIIGASRSAESATIIPLAAEDGVVVISPTNSDPLLDDIDTEGVFFRTASSDMLQGAALARALAQAGTLDSVMVLYRDDPFGSTIAEGFSAEFAALGGTAPTLAAYDPEAPESAVARAIVDSSASTVVLISLDEAGTILEALRQAGSSIWLTEPTFGIAAQLVDDPTSLAGVRGLIHQPFPDMPQAFLDRLQETPQQPTVLTYAAEAYDAVVIAALAAEVAGTDDTVAMAAAIPDVTRGGEPCTSYETCVELLGTGVDFDYDGIAGAYEFSDAGEPTVATYEWSRYDENGEIEAPLGAITVGE